MLLVLICRQRELTTIDKRAAVAVAATTTTSTATSIALPCLATTVVCEHLSSVVQGPTETHPKEH